MSLRSERRLVQQLRAHEEEIRSATASLAIRVYRRGVQVIDIEWGEVFPFYDLASLTKIIFSGTALMRAISRGEMRPEDPLHKYWSLWRRAKPTLAELMRHHSGLPWWLPYYQTLRGPRRAELRFQQVERRLARVRLRKSSRAIYSDPDLWCLGAALCEVEQKNLLEIWESFAQEKFFGRMHFNPGRQLRFSRQSYAPTERCLWRRRLLQGEVHDENAFAMGGVAPHAGLFGSIEDVGRYTLMLRDLHRGQSRCEINPKVFREFTRRQTSAKIGDWGFVFMKPTKGAASCGRYFSAKSFGHTGFTGTSIWFDPRRDLGVIILSNRVYPTRNNERFRALRPRLHDWAVEALKE